MYACASIVMPSTVNAPFTPRGARNKKIVVA